MKRLHTHLLIFIFFFFALEAGIAEVLLVSGDEKVQIETGGSDNLISAWMFEEGKNSVANDNVGSNHGRIVGATWSDERGLSFDGKDDCVLVENNASLNPEEELTISAWVRTLENKTAKIAQKGDWDGYGIYQGKWEGWKATLRTEDGEGYSLVWKDGEPELNQWYLLTLTYDGERMRFYVNTKQVASKKIGDDLKINSRDFSIGSDGGSQKFFNGDIDNVRFWDRAMTTKELDVIYKDELNEDRGDYIPFAYDGFSGDDYGWSGSWFEYSVNNGNKSFNADFNGYNYAYSKNEVSLNYEDTKTGISIKGGNVCVKSTNTAKGSESAALSRKLAKMENSWKSPLQETFYVSFLAQFSEKPKKGWDYLAIGAKQSGYDGGVALGSIYYKDKIGAAFAKDGSTRKNTSGKLPNANETYFVVGKFSTNSWGSVVGIDVFVNPTSLDTEKASYEASIKNSGYSNRNFYYYLSSIQLMSYFHDIAYFDEIRIGRTWKSVVSSLDNSETVEEENNITTFEGPTGYWYEADKWTNGLPTVNTDTVIIKGACSVDKEVEANDVLVVGTGKLYVAKGGKIKTNKPIKLKAEKEFVAEYLQEEKTEVISVEKEQYFSGGQWSFVCVPYDMTADELFPDLKLASSWSDPEADYWLLDYSQELRAATKDGMKDVFDGNYKLLEGRGYIVWLDTDMLRTFEYTSSESEISVTTTNSTETALSLNHAGWNLVGNPFSHTMSYEAVFDSSEHNQKYFNGAVYVWDGSGYKVWSRGIGDEDAREIGPLEAFFVKRTSDDPASAVFMMSDNGSYGSLENTIFSKSAKVEEEPSKLTVILNQMKGGLGDQTYIKIDDDASLGLDEELDGLKLQTSSAYNDYIYSTDDNNVFAVNSVALDGEYVEIPLTVNLAQGMDSILFGFLLEGDSTHAFALVDEDEMTMRPINHGDYVQIAADYEGKIEGRFSVFVTNVPDNETPIYSTAIIDNTLAKVISDDNTIYIESLSDHKLSVALIGLDGKIYDTSVLESRSAMVKNVNEGIYLLRISNGSEMVVHKILVD